MDLGGGDITGRTMMLEFPDRERALRDDVRLVGRVLGDTVREQQGDAVFATVERIRQISIAFRREGDAGARRELEAMLDSLSHDRTIEVVRAFSYFSHLANIAEDQHQIRCMRAPADGGPPGSPGTIQNTLAALKLAQVPRAILQALFDTILVSPVLTAHPTEVRRKSVLDREMEVAQLLAGRDRLALTPVEAAATDDALSRAVLILWQTSLLRRGKPTVVDEVANGLSYYDHTFFRELPGLYADLEDGLATIDPAWRNMELPSFIRMGSWIGGDRDGNPFVNAEVLRQAIEMQSKRVLDFYLDELHLLGGELSLNRSRISVSSQQMQFIEIEIEHSLALHLDGLAQHLRVHERVAIAIAADPASHANERWQLHIAPGRIDGRETIFEIRVQARQLAEERVVVVRQPVGDFVDDRGFPASQQAGLPEDQDGARKRVVGRGGFHRCECQAIAACEKLGDLHFAIEHALATHLGWMRGEHRAHQDRVEQRLQDRAWHLRQLERCQSVLDGSGRSRRATVRRRAHAADLVLVLGNIGEMREIAEGAHDLDGAVMREAIEHGFELAPGAGVALAPERDRNLPDALDRRKDGIALLLADGVAQHSSDQPDIVPQGSLAIREFQHHGAPRYVAPAQIHSEWLARSAPDHSSLNNARNCRVPSF